MYINVYNHTQHILLRSFITWEAISTLYIGHDQAIIQENGYTQESPKV